MTATFADVAAGFGEYQCKETPLRFARKTDTMDT